MSVKIAIDAGHGKYTAGKRCMKKLDPKETREWILNSRIANKLEAILADYECTILRVDDRTGAKDISLADRVKKANDWKADVYISIHHNAGVNGKSGGGTVVFYYSSKAERANQAKSLYSNVVGHTGLKGNRAQTVINKGFYVIKNTKMPSFLIENGFMDSSVDVPIILTEKHADKTATGLFYFLLNQFRLTKKKSAVTKATPFKVKVATKVEIRHGAGSNYARAGYANPGVYTITEVKNGYGRLKSGAGYIKLDSVTIL